MMYDNWDHAGGTDALGVVFMLLIMALIITVIVVLVRYSNRVGGDKKEDVIAILEKRFANGEIDKKEFEEKRKILSE